LARKWLGTRRLRQLSTDSKPTRVYKGYTIEEEDTGNEYEFTGSVWELKGDAEFTSGQSKPSKGKKGSKITESDTGKTFTWKNNSWEEDVVATTSSTPIAGNLAFAHTTSGYSGGSYSGEIEPIPDVTDYSFSIEGRTYKTFGSSGSGSIGVNKSYNKVVYTTSQLGGKAMNSLQLTLSYTDGTTISLNPNGSGTVELDVNKTVSGVSGSGTAPAVYARTSYVAGRNFYFTFYGVNTDLTKAISDGATIMSPNKMNPEFTMTFGATNVSEINFVHTGTAQNFEVYANNTLVRTLIGSGYIRFNAINCSSIRVKCIDTSVKTLGWTTFQYHSVSTDDFFTHGHRAIDTEDVELNSTAT